MSKPLTQNKTFREHGLYKLLLVYDKYQKWLFVFLSIIGKGVSWVISELLRYKNIETPRIRIHCTPESHILMSGLKTKKAAERKYKGRHFNIGEGTERIFEAFPPPESRLEFTQLSHLPISEFCSWLLQSLLSLYLSRN